MNRRRFLGALVVPALGAAPVVTLELDALLVGDSHAYQLGPRLGREARARNRQIETRAQGGTSARQWRERGWFRKAVADYPARTVLVSLGTNCVAPERLRLASDFGALAAITPIVVLYPPTTRFDVSYIARAVADAAATGAPISLWMAPVKGGLPVQPDRVHATAAGLELWAELLAKAMWS